jgi:hypothetical protein
MLSSAHIYNNVHFYVGILLAYIVTQEFVFSSAEGLLKLEFLDPKLGLKNFYMSSCFNIKALNLHTNVLRVLTWFSE